MGATYIMNVTTCLVKTQRSGVWHYANPDGIEIRFSKESKEEEESDMIEMDEKHAFRRPSGRLNHPAYVENVVTYCGHYFGDSSERVLIEIVHKGHKVKLCGFCARGKSAPCPNIWGDW